MIFGYVLLTAGALMALSIVLVYLLWKWNGESIDVLVAQLKKKTFAGNLLIWYIKKRSSVRLQKSYSFIDEHEEWLKSIRDDSGSGASRSTLKSWSFQNEAKSVLKDKLHLFQKLNYHRVVEEMNRQIRYVFLFLFLVSIGCVGLPIFYYNSPTLEPEANTEYQLFIHKIDSLYDEAGYFGDISIKKPRITKLTRQDSADISAFRKKSMEAKFTAISDFSSGYTSFLFIKQALIRFVTIVFLFTILGYLLRMYRRLLDKRTRFRQLEEATTTTLFYLFKKGASGKTEEERREVRLIEENLPKMIDKLFDFSVIEPAKGGKDDERINSAISEMNKAIQDLHETIKNLQQSSPSNRN